jgi:ketosteroid isomerase-like protein
VTADRSRLEALGQRLYDAWNSQEVDRVLACYTDDAVYVDPNTRGAVEGKAALQAYLTKLFDRWEMTWQGRELFPLDSVDGSAALWTATLRPKNTDQSITVNGMDLVILRGDQLARNEVYFDRSVLAPLLTAI